MIALVINLDRVPGRWAVVSAIAAERGLAVERLSAVDGRAAGALDGAAVRAGAPLTPPEVACFESHRRAWARIAAGPDAAGVVLEDDVYLGQGIVGFLAALEPVLGGVDLVKLNAHPRGMIVRSQPVAEVEGRRLLCPVQTTGDSSAYVITRDFAARALALHRGYERPVDVALFDPATGARVAQVDPAVTIQQRYARFRFLDEAMGQSDIQAKRVRPVRVGPVAALRGEVARFWRRRVVPGSQPVLNLVRAPGARQEFRKVAFDG